MNIIHQDKHNCQKYILASVFFPYTQYELLALNTYIKSFLKKKKRMLKYTFDEYFLYIQKLKTGFSRTKSLN